MGGNCSRGFSNVESLNQSQWKIVSRTTVHIRLVGSVEHHGKKPLAYLTSVVSADSELLSHIAPLSEVNCEPLLVSKSATRGEIMCTYVHP